MVIKVKDTVVDATGNYVTGSQLRITTLQAVRSTELEEITLVSDENGRIEFNLVEGRYKLENVSAGKPKLITTVTVTADMSGEFTFAELSRNNLPASDPEIIKLRKELSELKGAMNSVCKQDILDIINATIDRPFIDRLYKKRG